MAKSGVTGCPDCGEEGYSLPGGRCQQCCQIFYRSQGSPSAVRSSPAQNVTTTMEKSWIKIIPRSESSEKGPGKIYITFFCLFTSQSTFSLNFKYVSSSKKYLMKVCLTAEKGTLLSPAENNIFSFLSLNLIRNPSGSKDKNRHTDQPIKSLKNQPIIVFLACVLSLSLLYLPFHQIKLSSALSPSFWPLSLSGTDSLEKPSVFTNPFQLPLFIPLQTGFYLSPRFSYFQMLLLMSTRTPRFPNLISIYQYYFISNTLLYATEWAPLYYLRSLLSSLL